MTTLLSSGTVVLPSGPTDGWLALADGVIVDHGSGPAPARALDLGDRVLAAGLVDVQCNGVGATDLASASPAGWSGARRTLASHGITSFCPTFVTAPRADYPRLLTAAAGARDATAPDEADVLGVHLEGPFLGGAVGAHDPALVGPADLDWLRDLLAPHAGLVRMTTLAPEADPELSTVRWLVGSGVVVALGHSSAPAEDALRAADAGATVVTHLFNGMAPFHHRAPGLVGAALADERLTPTLIADLVHVHPLALHVAFAATTVAVVSDAVGAAPSPGGAAVLPDGTLAGSTTLLDGALANLVAIGVPWTRAVDAVTRVPARLVGAHDRGTLAIGARADVVALDPVSLAVERVWARGTPVDRADGGGHDDR